MLSYISVKVDEKVKKINIDSITPLNTQVFVRVIKIIKKQDKSSIILSNNNTVDKYCIAEVLKISTNVKGLKSGEFVMYKKDWSVFDFEVSGVKYSFLKYEDISSKSVAAE